MPVQGCLWGIWSQWKFEQCSVTCGNGTLSLSRTRTKHFGPFANSFCMGLSVESQSGECIEEKCPEQRGCRWTNWSPWISGNDECSVSCGKGGIRFQFRTRNEEYGSFRSKTCSGLSVEYITEACDETKCETRVCFWSDWTEWQQGQCSETCREGNRTDVRTRDKIYIDLEFVEGANLECDGDSVEMRSTLCSNDICGCRWTNWSPWISGNDECSVTCGKGIRFQYRTRNEEYGLFLSTTCSGLSEEYITESCETKCVTRDSCPPISNPRYGGSSLRECCMENTWHRPLGGRNYVTEELFGNATENNKCPIGQVFELNSHNSCGCVFDKTITPEWGIWIPWSGCDKRVCNIVHRVRFCSTESGRALTLPCCTKSCGQQVEEKQCCKELQGIDKNRAYEEFYNNATEQVEDGVKRRKRKQSNAFTRTTNSNYKVYARKSLSWVVSLKFKEADGNYEHKCGGVILSNKIIITAAHCIADLGCWDSNTKESTCDIAQWKIKAGEWNLGTANEAIQEISLKRIDVHENYKSVNNRKNSDIALIYLEGELDFSPNPFIQPALLPASRCVKSSSDGKQCTKTYNDIVESVDCFTAGWGKAESGNIRKTPGLIEVAMKDSTNDEVFKSESIGGEQLICEGYSGSPLMCNIRPPPAQCFIPPQDKVVIGLNSFVTLSGCKKIDQGNKEHVHASVVFHLEWIAKKAMEWAPWGRWSKCKNDVRRRARSVYIIEYAYLPGDGPLYQTHAIKGNTYELETGTC